MKKFVLTLSLVLSTAISVAQEAVEEIEPIAPMSPVCRELSGLVKLAYQINEAGVAINIKVVEADTEIFNRAAIKTLSKYRFKEGSYVVGETYNKVLEFKPKHKCQRNS
ncbi:energy transducer TonB [Microbulbifer sp. ZKSA002]|uniref:energy transducer TonB n=1 Tax=Microbulbifer sp. ZKSA002 TaxID=3243388 RepID=UPI004039E847